MSKNKVLKIEYQPKKLIEYHPELSEKLDENEKSNEKSQFIIVHHYCHHCKYPLSHFGCTNCGYTYTCYFSV